MRRGADPWPGHSSLRQGRSPPTLESNRRRTCPDRRRCNRSRPRPSGRAYRQPRGLSGRRCRHRYIRRRCTIRHHRCRMCRPKRQRPGCSCDQSHRWPAYTRYYQYRCKSYRAHSCLYKRSASRYHLYRTSRSRLCSWWSSPSYCRYRSLRSDRGHRRHRPRRCRCSSCQRYRPSHQRRRAPCSCQKYIQRSYTHWSRIRCSS
jgi:hypothetical protein